MARAGTDPEAASNGRDALRAPLLASDGIEERMGIDEMLRRYAGEFGAWQLRHFVLASLPWALEAFHTMIMIFADREPTPAGGALDPCGGAWEEPRGASTVSEWGLVCRDKYKVGLAQSAFFAGCMIGERPSAPPSPSSSSSSSSWRSLRYNYGFAIKNVCRPLLLV